jgi:biopolymer transport protein ExbB/TolQ
MKAAIAIDVTWLSQKRSLVISGLVIGSILALGPVWGLLGTVFGMSRAFRQLAGSGISDPRVLSASVGEALNLTMAGLLACPIGLALIVVCAIALSRLQKAPPPLPEGGRASSPPGA